MEPRHSRISALVDLVPTASVVAEIGTDAGALARRLVASGRATHCIATELDPKRLRRAQRLPPGDPRASRLELRSGDGLAPLRPADRIDVLVLAGLGGPSICRILDPERVAQLGIRRVVADPRTDLAAVRGRLRTLGFGIVDERVVADRGRYFTLIAAEAGRTEPGAPPGLGDGDVLEAGPLLLARRCPVACELWRTDLERLDRILRRPGSGPAHDAAVARRAAAIRILGWLEGDRRRATGGSTRPERRLAPETG